MRCFPLVADKENSSLVTEDLAKRQSQLILSLIKNNNKKVKTRLFVFMLRVVKNKAQLLKLLTNSNKKRRLAILLLLFQEHLIQHLCNTSPHTRAQQLLNIS